MCAGPPAWWIGLKCLGVVTANIKLYYCTVKIETVKECLGFV